jgi:hypothetical protein
VVSVQDVVVVSEVSVQAVVSAVAELDAVVAVQDAVVSAQAVVAVVAELDAVVVEAPLSAVVAGDVPLSSVERPRS